ncbi:DUF169 domain-containing protein [Faecalicatena sp. Marseille-Q4148]|nr:DUF169 domain-containing protein [Faecalicatena sp. Marseille-Q4148]
MFRENANKLQKALCLERKVMGVRFLFYKHNFEELKLPHFDKKTSFCVMARHAIDGNHFKVNYVNVVCRSAIETLGFEDPMPCMDSGERYFSLKLYESRAIAKAAAQSVPRIKHRIYGLELGPLEEMTDADVVVFMVNGYQLMRVIQGYAYKYGEPKNHHMIGLQGMCTDLVACPYERNDINYSAMCCGTRMMSQWKDEEIGVGISINKFIPMVEGVIQTLNYIEFPKYKEKIRQRLNYPEELGIIVDDNINASRLGKEYLRPHLYEQLKRGEYKSE